MVGLVRIVDCDRCEAWPGACATWHRNEEAGFVRTVYCTKSERFTACDVCQLKTNQGTHEPTLYR